MNMYIPVRQLHLYTSMTQVACFNNKRESITQCAQMLVHEHITDTHTNNIWSE